MLAAQLAAGARPTLNSADDDYRRKLVLRERQSSRSRSSTTPRPARHRAGDAEATERQLDVAQAAGAAGGDRRGRAERRGPAGDPGAGEDRRSTGASSRRRPRGLVEETFFEPGELVTAGQPVVSLLPDANRKVRFFLPEQRLAGIKIGDTMRCRLRRLRRGPRRRRSTFIATEAEFTPPIIYSQGQPREARLPRRGAGRSARPRASRSASRSTSG